MARPRSGRTGLPLGAFTRLAILVAAIAGLLALGPAVARPGLPRAFSPVSSLGGYVEPLCESHSSLCRDSYDSPGEEYVGHDEPSLAFKSSRPGSGNDITYDLRLPKEPPCLL